MSFKQDFNLQHPIFLGTQPMSVETPSDFQFTVCLSLKTSDLTKSFGFEDIIAAGTTEGPILIFGNDDNQLFPISLLCGHTSVITDMILSNNPDFFVSISYDSSVTVWSCQDVSAVFHVSLMIFPGWHRIAHVITELNNFWIWNENIFPILVDVTTGEIITDLDRVGVTSLLHISKHYYPNLPKDSLICVHSGVFEILATHDNVRYTSVSLYDIDQDFIEIPTTFGLLKLNGTFITIFEPFIDNVISMIDLKHGNLCSAIWPHQTSICVYSYDSFIFLISLKPVHRVDSYDYVVLSVQTLSVPEFIRSISYDKDTGVTLVCGTNIIKKLPCTLR